jgi:hypothetical protein
MTKHNQEQPLCLHTFLLLIEMSFGAPAIPLFLESAEPAKQTNNTVSTCTAMKDIFKATQPFFQPGISL